MINIKKYEKQADLKKNKKHGINLIKRIKDQKI